jgi:hypothetical protein
MNSFFQIVDQVDQKEKKKKKKKILSSEASSACDMISHQIERKKNHKKIKSKRFMKIDFSLAHNQHA